MFRATLVLADRSSSCCWSPAAAATDRPRRAAATPEAGPPLVGPAAGGPTSSTWTRSRPSARARSLAASSNRPATSASRRSTPAGPSSTRTSSRGGSSSSGRTARPATSPGFAPTQQTSSGRQSPRRFRRRRRRLSDPRRRCGCHSDLPTYLAAWREGSIVQTLLADGAGVDRRLRRARPPARLKILLKTAEALVELTLSSARSATSARVRAGRSGPCRARSTRPTPRCRGSCGARRPRSASRPMLPEEYGGGGSTDVFTQCSSRGSAGAAPGSETGRLERLLRRAGRQARHGRAEAPLARPMCSTLESSAPSRRPRPGVGSDAASMATTAARLNGGYRLHGQRTWVSNGGVATTTWSSPPSTRGQDTRASRRSWSRKDDEGVTFGQADAEDGPARDSEHRDLPGTRSCPRTGDSATRGRASTGSRAPSTRSRSSSAPPAPRPGARPSTRSSTREGQVQFGKPIAEHQAVAFRLADMATKSGLAAPRLEGGQEAGRRRAGAARGGDGEAPRVEAMFCTWAAVQTLGGWAYSRDASEKWMRTRSSRRSRRARRTSSA